jgi:hypothetical protein
MASSIVTTIGKNLYLNRIYKNTPDSSAPVVFAIGTSTTVPVVGDTNLGTIIQGWNASSDYKNFTTGFPTFNTTAKEATIRGAVTSTEANGSNIAEAGTFNSDGTRVMDFRATFSAVNKDSGESISFIWKHRIL